jgi:pyruvyl transferase EpsI
MYTIKSIKLKLTRRITYIEIVLDCLFFFLLNIGRKKSILIGTPHYTNIGDTAISEATKLWIKNNLHDFVLYEVREDKVTSLKYIIQSFLKKRDILLLQGGGNLGDRYPILENTRRDIIKRFTNNKIIILPQTIFFNQSESGEKELEISKIIYNQHPNLIIFTRDDQSFQFAKEHFYNCQIELTADMVCTMSITTNKVRINKVLLCKRTDCETSISAEEIENRLDNLKIKYNYQDTELSTTKNAFIKKFSFKNDKERISDFYSILELFSTHKCIITDRYHGLIFSFITRTPCIVIKSIDHKIETGMKWFTNSKFIFYIGTDLDQIQAICTKILLEDDVNRSLPVTTDIEDMLNKKLLLKIRNN